LRCPEDVEAKTYDGTDALTEGVCQARIGRDVLLAAAVADSLGLWERLSLGVLIRCGGDLSYASGGELLDERQQAETLGLGLIITLSGALLLLL
jgi:hypothetical protein